MTTLLSAAKIACCAAYKYSGAAAIRDLVARRAGRQSLALLLFHRVTDAIPEDGLTIPTARFRSICALLRQCFHVVPLATIFALVRSGRPLPARTVGITFDDCYRDNLAAAQVLLEHGLPATFFLPTGFVGTDKVFPWDVHLPRLPNLTWDEVRFLVEMGFEVGSHTVNHPDLGSAPQDAVRHELIASRNELEQRLDCRVRWFAYPFGDVHHFRPGLLPLLEEAGYEGCVSAIGGLIEPGCGPVLPRVPVPYFKSLMHFELHLRGSLGWAYRLLRRLGLSVEPGVQPRDEGQRSEVRGQRSEVVDDFLTSDF